MKPFACSLNLIELKIVNKKLPQGLQTKAAKQMSLGEKIIFLTVSAPPQSYSTIRESLLKGQEQHVAFSEDQVKFCYEFWAVDFA